GRLHRAYRIARPPAVIEILDRLRQRIAVRGDEDRSTELSTQQKSVLPKPAPLERGPDRGDIGTEGLVVIEVRDDRGVDRLLSDRVSCFGALRHRNPGAKGT